MGAPRAALFGAAALLAAFSGVFLISQSQPRFSTVTVMCVDDHGHPIAGADVSVSPVSTSADAGASSDEAFDLFSVEAPAPSGWRQGLASDATRAAGSDSLSGVSDAQGRAVINGVPAGEIRIDASADGFQYCSSGDACQSSIPEGQAAGHFKVGEETSAAYKVVLSESGDFLNFSNTMATVRPTDDAMIGLNGTAKDRAITLSLDRVDMDGVLTHAPEMLAGVGEGNASVPTWDGEFTTVRSWPLAPAPTRRSFYKTIHLGKLPEGLYRIVAHNASVEAEGWLLSTGIGVVRKSWAGHVLAFAGDLTTGQPVSGTAIVCAETTQRGPKTLAQAETDASGLARFDARSSDEESRGVVVARSGASYAAVSTTLNREQGGPSGDVGEGGDTAASSGALRSFIYTDRPIYRPGHTVSFKGIERFFSTLNGPAFTIPENTDVAVDIRDPQNTLVKHFALRTNRMGSWHGTLPLSTEALTGEYTIRATVGEASSESSFVVAAYRKPQYRVSVTFDKKRYVRGDTVRATVSAQYYFGTPVAGGDVSYDITASGGDYEGGSEGAYTNPTAPANSSGGEPTISGNIKLDARGQAAITLPTKVDKDESVDQTYTFDVTVSDKSGQSVTQSADVDVAQGEISLSTQTDRYIAGPNQPVSVTVSASDADDKPVAGVRVRLVSAFESWPKGVQRLSGIHEQTATTDATGNALFTVSAPHAGDFLIRSSASDARGNSIRTEDTLWVIDQTAAASDFGVPLPSLSVILDKKSYRAGDTAQVLINADKAGPDALVTIEGASLYRSWTVPLKTRSTSFTIPVDRRYVPGVTIGVCCFSNGQFLQTSQTLTVDAPANGLAIQVTSDAPTHKPGDPVTIQVSTHDGTGKAVPAEVSVGVVDSAVYGIKEDDADIAQAFSRDQGNAVDTADSAEPLYLGDVDKGEIGVKIRRRLPDTAYWNPVVDTGPAGTASVSFTLPENLTTWRVTCFVKTAETEVGKGVGTFVVGKDLVSRIEAPAFLTVGDHATVSVVANNNTAEARDIRLTLSGAPTSGAIVRIEGGGQTIHVPAGGSGRADWPVTAVALAPGAAGVPAPVELDGAVVSGSLSDGVAQELMVNPHASTQDTWVSGSLLREVDQTLDVAPGALSAGVRMRVHLAPTVSGSLIPAAEYLSSYPYGTTDSIASVLIGDVSIARIAAGNDPALPVATSTRRRLDDEIARSLLRLYRFQHDDGSFGWTETDPYHDLWMTADATYAIGEAAKAGYPVNQDAYKNALVETRQLVKDWGHREPHAVYGGHLHPLALAALALSAGGDADGTRSALEALEGVWAAHPQDRSYSDMAVAAMTYGATGSQGKQRADALMAQLWSARRRMGALASWPYGPSAPSFVQAPSDATATAWVLYALETVQPADRRNDAVARWFMANRSGDHWELYDTTAITLMALTQYLSEDHEMSPDFKATLTVNGHSVRTLRFGPGSIREPEVVIDVPASAVIPGMNRVRLTKTGTGRLYYSIDLREALPEAAPAAPPSFPQRIAARLFHPESLAQPPLDASGYRIKRVYLRNTSRRTFLWEDTVPAPGTDYRRQDSVLVRLLIDCVRPGSHVIIEEPIPAGCTVTDVSGDEEESWDKWWSYTDVRDDKIVFFVDEMTRGRNEIDYHLMASTPGVFDAMPTQITGTFDPTLRSHGRASRVTVESDR